MACPHTSSCALFSRLKASLAVWPLQYCDPARKFDSCARYKLSRSGKAVPITLMPNGQDLQAKARK